MSDVAVSIPEPSRQRSEFASGWPVLIASTIGVGLGTTGLAFFSFGQFVRPLAAEFHWGRGSISGGVLCLQAGTVVMSPLIGYAIDRIGIRTVAMLSQVGLAVGFLLLSLINGNIWTFYCAWLTLSFLGAGTSPIVWTRAAAGFFVKYRGLALGILLTGTGIAAVLAPITISPIIADHGWRAAYRVLSAVILVSIPLTYLFLPRSNEAGSKAATVHTGMSMPAALRTFPFWRIICAFVFASIAAGALIVHLPALLGDRGSSVAAAARIVGTMGYATITGRLLLGFLMDRLSPTITGGIFILFASASSLLLARNVAILPAVLLLGLFGGAEVDLLSFLMSRLFGLKHYAQIYGWGISAFTLGAGLGPILFGYIYDRTSSYEFALYLVALCPVLSAALIFSLKRPLANSPYRELQRAS